MKVQPAGSYRRMTWTLTFNQLQVNYTVKDKTPYSISKHFFNIKMTTLSTKEFSSVNIKTKQKTKKWQSAEWDTQDLIQTWCVPHSRLPRPNKKNIQNKKMKTNNHSTKVTLVNPYYNVKNKTKTKKWQPAAARWDTQDLIQTWCVPHSRLPHQKNKQNEKNENTKYYNKVTLVEQDDCLNSMNKVKKIKTKKCQPAEGDTQDLIQTWCVPHSRLARPNKKK